MTKEDQGQTIAEDVVKGSDAVQMDESGEVVEIDSEQASRMETEVEAEEECEAEADPVAVLTAELEEARGQAAEYLDGWQRARAEFANYRRRQEQRQKQMDIDAKSRVLTHLLAVIDDLERAFEAVPLDMEDHSWVTGLSMVGQKLQTALAKTGLSAVAVDPGDVFDPNYHQALTHEPNDDCDEGTIIQVVQRGYVFDDVVLRPALVRVSCGKIDNDEQAKVD